MKFTIQIGRYFHLDLCIYHNTFFMPSGRLPSPRSRPTGSRTALKPADDKARLMMSFKAECRGKRPALKRQERGCWPYLYTMAPQRHLCVAQTGSPRR